MLVARLEAGVLEENAEQFDPGELVRDFAELYEPVAEERGLKLALDIAEGSRLTANRQLVGQAVANLIDNAIKYSAKAKDPTIAIELHADEDGVEIAVADHGPALRRAIASAS